MVAYCDGKPDERLTADEQAFVVKWLTRGAALEFRADDGRPMAMFAPLAPLLYEDDPPLPAEEVERRLRESPRSTLAEFWQRMGVA